MMTSSESVPERYWLAEDDLKIKDNREAIIELLIQTTIKLLGLRDGVQSSDTKAKFRERIRIFLLEVIVSKALITKHEQEIGFPGSNAVVDKLIEECSAFLQNEGMEYAPVTFIRTHSPGMKADKCKNFVTAVSKTLDAGIKKITLVSKGTEESAKANFRLEDAQEHLTMIRQSFAYITDQYKERGVEGYELTLDPEHSFHALIRCGQKGREFFVDSLIAAYEGGCRKFVLCDTTGMTRHTHVVEAIRFLFGIKFSNDFPGKAKIWERILEECEFGIHLHDDGGLSAAAFEDVIEQSALRPKKIRVTHADGTLGTSSERAGGNSKILAWIARMYQVEGIDVIKPEHRGIWRHLGAIAQAESNLMFGESLDRRELFFGLLAAFQSAGMHSSASEFKASKEYRPDAMWLNNSVFDMLEKDEDFGLGLDSGKGNFQRNLRQFGLEDKIPVGSPKYTAFQKLIKTNPNNICYTLHKATAALDAWEIGDEKKRTDVLSVEETRVTGTIYGDRGSSAAASILLDRNTSDTQNWVEANSDHGLLDAQLKALKGALDGAKEHYRLGKMKIVSYHQDDVVTGGEKGSRSRVSTSIVFRDEETRHTWAINTIEDSAFDSAYEGLLDGIRYAHLVRIGKLQHHQDKTLDDIFGLSTDELILRCGDIVGLSNRRVKELLDLEEPSEEETES